jgi:predicted ATPase
MLTRLKVSGFKNLVDVDVQFGAFTCIAGGNGVGKSNLFDAIKFLSALASSSLVDAARSVRDASSSISDIRGLFHCVGDTYADRMEFEVEMIVPQDGIEHEMDPPIPASQQRLRYSLHLGYFPEPLEQMRSPLKILKEELVSISLLELGFPYSAEWCKAIFSETSIEQSNQFIFTYDEGVTFFTTTGLPLHKGTAQMTRTVLSEANDISTHLKSARLEMESWRLLQFAPAALRKPDEWLAPTELGADGSHLPATLYRIAQNQNSGQRAEDSKVYWEMANLLATLINDVAQVWVDRDDKREILTLMVRQRNGSVYPAKALSDGTLRFLALAALALDFQAEGVFCIEEPENGIHPERIPKILNLLQDMAVDTQDAIGPDNPLRQVIISTHSPAVVLQVPAESLVIADLQKAIAPDGQRYQKARFGYLADNWRAKNDTNDRNIVPKGRLLSYFNPVSDEDEPSDRVIDDWLAKK